MKTNYAIILLLAIGLAASCSDDGVSPPASSSAYISKVYEFTPAVGQFINELPRYTDGDTPETMVAKAEELIKGAIPTKGMISLGGFGGYVVFGFDHMIENVDGYRDFRVYGNTIWASGKESERGGSCEPGVIMVSHDANGNGIPDDEWYEIAGSEYTQSVKNYTITYHKPDSDESDIRWVDNQGSSGYIAKNQFHTQSYWPQWVTSPTLTFTGTRLPDNGINEGGDEEYWVLYSYAYGYADNVPNGDDQSTIDISWAVDADGKSVDLPGIHFVKVYCGIRQECGWIGETSTEVAGACDLHMLGISIASR